ncbi:MAG: ParB/RepB/Spo0J family partition protein [Azospirillum sp.]|nr:ParB/RepB/Spo0J family partition protein [Azospirillum sp.]
MKLQHIQLSNLKTAPLNVRKKGGKDISDLLPSIRAQGLLQPLLVRPNCEGFEVVAGQRRYHALEKLAAEGSGIEAVPCLVMEAGDDAKAVEASLAENIARLPMDEIDQYKAFAALIRQGRGAEDIAAHFGITERLVGQRLAIANLIAPILKAYQGGDLHPSTLRILTMATKTQQKAWWALYESEDEHAPEGHRLKSWLFGGEQILTTSALFELSEYDGALISDLFGEEVYFDNPEKFWTLQNKAIAALRQARLDEGWAEVVLLDTGEHWRSWEHVDTAKEDGGKVYIVPSRNGEVTVYEGQLPRKEAERRLKPAEGETGASAPKPEITKAMQNYLDVHRHAAVRATLPDHGGIALRLAVAQIIAGSELWEVHADPQKTATDEIGQSLAANKAEERFAEQRRKVRGYLGMDGAAEGTLVYRQHDWGKSHDLHAVFARLLTLEDSAVLEVLAFVTAETLPSGSAMVEVLGKLLGVDMAAFWSPDETFFDLMRDKEAINAMLGEVSGKAVAEGNITATAKVQKKIVVDCISGARKPAKPDWHPRYMQFPMASYTKRGGLRAAEDWKTVGKFYR